MADMNSHQRSLCQRGGEGHSATTLPEGTDAPPPHLQAQLSAEDLPRPARGRGSQAGPFAKRHQMGALVSSLMVAPGA